MKAIRPRHSLAALVAALALVTAQPVHAQVSNADAVDLVLPFGQLRNTSEGQDALDQNLITIFDLQNSATRAEQLQAIKDFTIDWDRGTSVADGLGSGFRDAYFKAIFAGTPSVTTGDVLKFMSSGMEAASSLISVVKSTFGDNHTHLLHDGAEFDVYGRSYLPGATDNDRDELAHSINKQLNPRPFQVAPYNSPDEIVEFDGKQFVAPQPGGGSTIGKTTTNTALNQDVRNEASFLSGHTTYAYSASILLAMMVPERYQEQIYRASEFANGRIVMGAHYPLDVIGGRVLATYALANWLSDPANQQLMQSAATELQKLLTTGTDSSNFDEAVAKQDTWTEAELDAARAKYAYRMTYGLPNVGSTSDDPPDIAHFLLMTRFPYLSEEQQQEVIRTTMLADAGPLANDMPGFEAWTRINLFDAAGGYGSLVADTTVNMDGSQGGLFAYDTWNNDIDGTGYLIKRGTGRLELSGDNSFGGFRVEEGNLLFSGSNVFPGVGSVGGEGVAAGLFLASAMTLSSLAVRELGTLGRVGDYGETDLSGDLSFAGDATLLVRFGGAAVPTDFFTVTGSTQIAPGSVFQMINPELNAPTSAGGEITILTATGGITGQFDEALLPNSFATTFALMSDASRVYLTVTTHPLSGAADTPTQRALADYIDALVAFGSSPRTEKLTNAIRNLATRAEVQDALDQLTPQIYSDAQISTLYASLAFASSMLSCRVNGETAASIIEEGQCLWAGASATFLKQDAMFNQAAFSEQTGSFAAGAQVALDESWRLGFAVGHQTSALSAQNASSEAEMGQAGVALKYNDGPLLLAAVVTGGRGWYETKRVQSFSGFTGLAESDTTIDVLNGGARLTYVFGSPNLYLKPVLDAAATRLDLDGATENGSGANLAVAGSQQTVYTIAPTIEMGTEWWLSNGTLVRPFLRAGAAFYEGGDFAVSATFAGAPLGAVAPFSITTEMDDVMGILGAGLDLITGGDTVLHATYDGQLGANTQIHSIALKGSVRY